MTQLEIMDTIRREIREKGISQAEFSRMLGYGPQKFETDYYRVRHGRTICKSSLEMYLSFIGFKLTIERVEKAVNGMIVITNMESLPDHCYECPCRDGELGYCQADKERRYSDYRPYWCPLKEIVQPATVYLEGGISDIGKR